MKHQNKLLKFSVVPLVEAHVADDRWIYASGEL